MLSLANPFSLTTNTFFVATQQCKLHNLKWGDPTVSKKFTWALAIERCEWRKCGCPFKFRAKLVLEGEGWMVNLICGTHNHALAKSFTGHPYVGRLTKDEKIIIGDMIKSMIKPKNILLTLKEHNANNCTTMKQVYNVRYAYHSYIRGNNSEMQQLMKLLECN